MWSTGQGCVKGNPGSFNLREALYHLPEVPHLQTGQLCLPSPGAVTVRIPLLEALATHPSQYQACLPTIVTAGGAPQKGMLTPTIAPSKNQAVGYYLLELYLHWAGLVPGLARMWTAVLTLV